MGMSVLLNALSTVASPGGQLKLRSVSYVHPKVFSFSGENSSSLDTDGHFKPSPRPRSMLKKSWHPEEGVRSGVDKEYSTTEDSAPTPSLPRQNGTELQTEEKVCSENLDLEVSIMWNY